MENEKGALIIVDVQNDFCPGGALPVAHGDEIVARLNKLIEAVARAGQPIVYSRDWHPVMTCHFRQYGGFWPAHCLQYTSGAEFHPALKVPQDAVIVSKGMDNKDDGYSAFEGRILADGDKTLEEYLREQGVTDLCVGGLATDYCVKATVLDAQKLGFRVHLLLDACRAVDVNSGDGDKAVEEMYRAGASIDAVWWWILNGHL